MLLVFYLLIYSVLTLALFYKVQGSYTVKILSVAVAMGIATSAYFSLSDWRGWPTSGGIESKVYLVAVLVVEPSPGDKGNVYLWTTGEVSHKRFGFISYDSSPGEPKAHAIGYTEGNSEFAYKAKKALEAGDMVLIDPNGGQQAEGEQSEEQADGEGSGGGGTFYQEGSSTGFEILNSHKLPPK